MLPWIARLGAMAAAALAVPCVFFRVPFVLRSCNRLRPNCLLADADDRGLDHLLFLLNAAYCDRIDSCQAHGTWRQRARRRLNGRDFVSGVARRTVRLLPKGHRATNLLLLLLPPVRVRQVILSFLQMIDQTVAQSKPAPHEDARRARRRCLVGSVAREHRGWL